MEADCLLLLVVVLLCQVRSSWHGHKIEWHNVIYDAVRYLYLKRLTGYHSFSSLLMASLLTPGGSTHQSLLSLAPSSSSTISYYHTLPHPRSSGPLKSGSRSESNLITYLDDQLLQISRKYTKKYNESGYTTINAVVKDLERLVDILWVSSTRLSPKLYHRTFSLTAPRDSSVLL